MTAMRHRLALVGALCGFGLGCGVTVNYHRLNAKPTDMDPKEPYEVNVYTTTAPPYDYVDVGMLEVRQESVFTQVSEQGVFKAMRREAAKRGCDGLIMMGSADAVVGAYSAGRTGGSGFTTTLHGYRATCIARLPTPPRPPPAVAVRRPSPPEPAPVPPSSFVDPFAGDAPPGPPAPAAACSPLCSPGYDCQGGACVPACNPACGAGEVCSADRTCRQR
jgi:hypothetical protein